MALAATYWDSVFVYATSLAFSSCECNCLLCFSVSITQTVTHHSGNIMFPQEWQIMAYWNIGEGKRASGEFHKKMETHVWHPQRLGLLSDGALWLTEKTWIKHHNSSGSQSFHNSFKCWRYWHFLFKPRVLNCAKSQWLSGCNYPRYIMFLANTPHSVAPFPSWSWSVRSSLAQGTELS